MMVLQSWLESKCELKTNCSSIEPKEDSNSLVEGQQESRILEKMFPESSGNIHVISIFLISSCGIFSASFNLF